jgi:hypothetical protein
MVKKTIVMTSLAVLLSAPPASARDVNDQVQELVALLGPQTLVEVGADARGIEFAGRFATPRVAGDPALAALMFLERHHAVMGFDPLVALADPTVTGNSGLTHVRFAQHHDGVPVEGADVVVTVDDLGSVRQVSSGFQWLEAFAPPLPSLGVDEAAARVTARMDHLVFTGDFRLTYLPFVGGTSPLALALEFDSTSGPERPEVFVDAHTGELLGAFDTNIYYRQAEVYDPNPATAPDLVTVDLPNLVSDTNLEGTYARAWKCTAGGGWDMCPDRERLAVPDGSGDYFYEPDEPSTTDPFAEVMAYYHMDKINTHMEEAYGHEYTCSGHRWMDVHVNMDYENAWYGDQNDDGCPDVTIGQGAQDFAYDSAILYHEFGHGINHQLNSISSWAFDILGPDMSPQGFDEALADYWAASFIGRPVIGEYAGMGTPGEVGIRDVSEFAQCPDHLYGEGHYDSPILSSTLWDIREAIGQEKTDRLALALLGSTSRTPDFDEAGQALISQAAGLEGTGVLTPADVAVVENAVDEHTLVGCERIVPMEHEESHIFLAVGYGGAQIPSGVQFYIYAPPTATRISASFDQLSIGGGYTVYVRRHEPVAFSLSGYSISIDEWDMRYDASPDRVTYTPWSDPPLEQDTRYYFTYVHDSQTMVLGVEATVVASEPTDAVTDVIEDPVPDPVEDPASDVPGDAADDVPGDTADDVPGDGGPDAISDADTDDPDGSIKSSGGCGCSIVR